MVFHIIELGQITGGFGKYVNNLILMFNLNTFILQNNYILLMLVIILTTIFNHKKADKIIIRNYKISYYFILSFIFLFTILNWLAKEFVK